MLKKMFNYFSNPVHLAVLNGCLIFISILGNVYFQVFCIPTLWASLVLVLSFGITIFYPLLLHQKKYLSMSSFFSGIACCVYLYCICFLGKMNLLTLILIPLLGLGLLTYMPHFFTLQLLWYNLVHPPLKKLRFFFLAAFFLCGIVCYYIGKQYEQGMLDIQASEKIKFQDLKQTFMTEKILGMHFIYHTQFCEYDGWRPPLHEPFLVIGMWMNGRKDPLKVDLETRIELYKKFFPNNPYKFDCSCAISYSNSYENDPVWK